MPTTLEPSTWRLQTAGGIPYKLVEGYPKINGAEGGASAAEQYIIRASDTNAFFTESLPAPVVYLGSIYKPLRRAMPGAPVLLTKTISFEPMNGTLPADPFGNDSGAPSKTYDPFVRVTIQYETVQNESDQEQDPNDPDTFLEHSITAAGEFMSWPSNKTRKADAEAGEYVPGGGWTPNKDPLGPIIKTIPTIEHNLRWKYCLSPNWERIIEFLGHVNDRTIEKFFDAPAECVLYMGVSGSQTYLWDGASTGVQPWSLDFRFSHKQITESGKTYGWNHVYSPNDGAWRKVQRADGNLLFFDADLMTLFTA
jgi:hypothetical protein